MAERIYTRDEQGKLEPLGEADFSSEDDLQVLLAEHPELIDGERIRPDDPRRWILIKREKGIAKTPDAGDHWALDLLLIDQDGIPTLVEVKRGSNSEIRRKVVGQMLEYAAHATVSWSAGNIRRDFEERTDDPDAALRVLLGEDPDTEAFWESVRLNLSAKRIRLLFLADRIPSELERIVTFLNQQMQNVEVLAVEIKQFSGETTQTLVPRVIGLTAAAPSKSASRPKLDRKSFLAEFTGDERGAVERLLNVPSRSGGTLGWASLSVSLRGEYPPHPRPVPVARIYIPSMESSMGSVLYFGWEGPTFGYPPELEQRLREWTSQFKDDSFTTTGGTLGYWWTVTPSDAAEHIDLLASRLAAVLSDLKSLNAAEGP